MDSDYQIPPKPDCCQLCNRPMVALTRHHLIPRARHNKKRNRRLFDRQDVRTRILWICRPCHNHIHDVLTEKQMEAEYYSRDRLIAHPDIRRFVDWIGNRPAEFRPGRRNTKRR